MKHHTVLRLTLVTALIVFTTAASASKTWDAVNGFGTSNPSGAWAYGYGITGTSFTAYSTLTMPQCWDLSGINWWHGPDYFEVIPYLGLNTTGHYLSNGAQISPPDALTVHPSGPPYQTADTILRWTAPDTAAYNIWGYFEILDITPSGIVGSVYDHGLQLYSGELLGPGARPPDTVGGIEYFKFTDLQLSAGDVIYFGIDADGSISNDTSGLEARISEVPDPGSFLLFASSVITVVGVSRRKLGIRC
jgi:hypothetical protein